MPDRDYRCATAVLLTIADPLSTFLAPPAPANTPANPLIAQFSLEVPRG